MKNEMECKQILYCEEQLGKPTLEELWGDTQSIFQDFTPKYTNNGLLRPASDCSLSEIWDEEVASYTYTERLACLSTM